MLSTARAGLVGGEVTTARPALITGHLGAVLAFPSALPDVEVGRRVCVVYALLVGAPGAGIFHPDMAVFMSVGNSSPRDPLPASLSADFRHPVVAQAEIQTPFGCLNHGLPRDAALKGRGSDPRSEDAS